MWREQISIAGPYNFDRVLERLSLDPLHAVDVENRSVKVPIKVTGEKTSITVTATGHVDEPSFIIEGSDEKLKAPAIERVSEIFQWGIPLQEIHEHFQNTRLKELFDEHRGTPLVLDFDPYGSLIKSIIHQQLNLKFGFTLTQRLVKTFGQEVDGAWFFPEPEILASLTVEQLREMQFSMRKAEYIIGIAQLAAEGKLDFEKIKLKTDEEIMEELIKIRGVGQWTVQNFLLFGLGRPNLFPPADIGIQNALKKWYGLDRKPTFDEMMEMKRGWDPYLSYASLYLWRSIE